MTTILSTPAEITENVGKKVRIEYKNNWGQGPQEGEIFRSEEGDWKVQPHWRIFQHDGKPESGIYDNIARVLLLEDVEPLAGWERELMDATRIQQLEEETQRLTNALETEKIRHNEHLVRIGEKAMSLAGQHGWCEVVEEGLVGMGVPVPSNKYVVEMTVRVEVEGSRSFARYVNERKDDCIAETFQITHDEDVENMIDCDVSVTSVEKVG